MADERMSGPRVPEISEAPVLSGVSIGRRLSRRILLLSVITVVILLGTVYLGGLNVFSRASRDILTSRTEAERVFTRFLQDIFKDLRVTSDALTVGGDPDALFRRALSRQTVYFDLRLIDERGQVLAGRRRLGTVPTSVESQPWLITVSSGEIYIGSVEYDEYGVPVVPIAVRVDDEDGDFYGSLVAKVDLTALWDVVTSFRIGEAGYVYITHWNGEVIMHPNLEMVRVSMQRTPEGEVERPALQEIAAQDHAFYTGYRDELVFASAGPIISEVMDWYVVAEQPVGEIIQPLIDEAVILLILLIGILVLVAGIFNFARRRIVRPLGVLRENVIALGEGDLEQRIPLETDDEFGALATMLNTLAAQLQEVINTLEQRIAERTRGLRAAAEISRATTTVLDPDELQRETVELIQDHFALYYVGLFMVDEAGEYAVLQAATGEAGKEMLASGHRLRIGGATMIGQCVSMGKGRIALDVGAEASRFDNPLLPETHSEMALPLQARGRVIGALSVQSKEIAAFDEADIAVMQTMADQVAVAIDNAQLFTESQAALEEMEAIQQRYTEQSWGAFTRKRIIKGYEQTSAGLKPLDEVAHQDELQKVLSALRDEEQSARSVVLGDEEEHTARAVAKVLVPILQRERPIGVLGCEAQDEGRPWSRDQIALVESVAEQFAIAAENLRLLEETQRRAAREQAVTEITAKIRAEVEIESMLEEALSELGRILGADRGLARLALGQKIASETEEASAGIQAQKDGNGDGYG
ncbi:MAG: GAF domain-containing protein [Chloroflexi bacterium]|nr:GAF domain-containing protein [Chloroflexota bacterium]